MANLYDDLRKQLKRGAGVAKSNQFRVTIPGIWQLDLKGFDVSNDTRESMELLCSQASLPSVQAATGQVNGYYTGHSMKYPTMKMYNDLSLTFICDANMTAYKVFHAWFDKIFQEVDGDGNNIDVMEGWTQSPDRDRNRFTRVAYPDQYQMSLLVDKFEPGPVNRSQTKSMRYWFQNVYPYSIDAVPLDAGTTTLVTCTVNLYYERYEVQFEDALTNFKSMSQLDRYPLPKSLRKTLRRIDDKTKKFSKNLKQALGD